MAKCRGCGGDTRDYQGGPGWMHYECEINRLTGLLEEAEAMIDALADHIPVDLIMFANGGIKAPPVEQWIIPQTGQ